MFCGRHLDWTFPTNSNAVVYLMQSLLWGSAGRKREQLSSRQCFTNTAFRMFDIWISRVNCHLVLVVFSDCSSVLAKQWLQECVFYKQADDVEMRSSPFRGVVFARVYFLVNMSRCVKKQNTLVQLVASSEIVSGKRPRSLDSTMWWVRGTVPLCQDCKCMSLPTWCGCATLKILYRLVSGVLQ